MTGQNTVEAPAESSRPQSSLSHVWNCRQPQNHQGAQSQAGYPQQVQPLRGIRADGDLEPDGPAEIQFVFRQGGQIRVPEGRQYEHQGNEK